MEKIPVGRPSKQNKETVKKLEEAFAIGATVEAACFWADISRESYYQWMKANKQLSDRLTAVRQRPILQALQTSANALSDPRHARWFLERKMKKEYSSRQEISGPDGGPVEVNLEAREKTKKALSNVLKKYGGNIGNS